MNERRASSAIVKVAVAVFIVFVLFAIASTKLVYNQLSEEYELLAIQNEKLTRDIEKTRLYLLAEFDEEYVRRIARENGYCDPDEVVVDK